MIIDLVESWEEGMQLGFWLNQHPLSCPIILIVPPETSAAPLTKAPFIAIPAPVSLDDFTTRVRTVLALPKENMEASRSNENGKTPHHAENSSRESSNHRG